MREKVEKILGTIRPSLQMDGGDVELVSVDETTGKVFVKLTGACGCCPMSTMTLKYTVEKTIRDAVPEVTSVEAI